MENAAMNARVANPRARYGRRVEVGLTSTIRGISPDEEDVVGRVDKISCTYPIDFNPWILCTRFRTWCHHPWKRQKLTSILPGSS